MTSIKTTVLKHILHKYPVGATSNEVIALKYCCLWIDELFLKLEDTFLKITLHGLHKGFQYTILNYSSPTFFDELDTLINENRGI